MIEIKRQFKAVNDTIGDAVIFVENELRAKGGIENEIARNLIALEELLVQMVANATSDEDVYTVAISKKYKSTQIRVVCKGKAFSLDIKNTVSNLADTSDLDDEQAVIISNMVLKLYSDNIRLKNTNGYNKAEIKIKRKTKVNSLILCIVVGILGGILMRLFLPENINAIVSENIFSSVSTVFLNAIKMVIAPVVFFSIAESMMGFSDYKTFGKIGAKVVGLYFVTTFVAIGIGLVVTFIVNPGKPELLPEIMSMIKDAGTSDTVEVSIKSFLIGIVPSNLLNAFVKADMLQLIFIGILVGIASGLLGEQSVHVQGFLKAGNALFTKITEIITKALPVAMICIMGQLVLSISLDSIKMLLVVMGCCLIANALLIMFYSGMVLFIGKVSIKRFFVSFKDAFLTAFSTASSSVAIPMNMKGAKKMGISSRLYSFSIPLGATINMDGGSLVYAVLVMFMAGVFGVELNLSVILTMFFMISFVAMGIPGIPGSYIIGASVVFQQVGIVPEAVMYVAALMTILDFVATASNVIGDATVTTVVARTEGLMENV